MRNVFVAGLVAGVVVAAAAPPALAQAPLTLSEAIRMATDHSESVAIARTSESRANADQQRAFSQKLPQITFAGSYARTLASEFSGAFQPSGPVCDPLHVDASQPLAARVSEIERAASCGAIGPSLNFG
jgi:outer membrane protein TolC